MRDAKIINMFIKTFPNLKTVRWKYVDKQKNKSSRINFIYFCHRNAKKLKGTLMQIWKSPYKIVFI